MIMLIMNFVKTAIVNENCMLFSRTLFSMNQRSFTTKKYAIISYLFLKVRNYVYYVFITRIQHSNANVQK